MDTGRGIPDGTENDSPSLQNVSASPQQTSVSWAPNDTHLKALTSMGISLNAAKKALFYTDNSSAEVAIEWIFNRSNPEDLESPFDLNALAINPSNASQLNTPAASSGVRSIQPTANSSDDEDDSLYKMVFVVNSELSMGVGKIAAQVAHAALGLHRILLQFQSKYGESLLNWNEYGETKIVLRGESTKHLIDLERKAIECDLPCYLVHDAGKTQVKAGSTTVLAVFGSIRNVDKVTSSLKLY